MPTSDPLRAMTRTDESANSAMWSSCPCGSSIGSRLQEEVGQQVGVLDVRVCRKIGDTRLGEHLFVDEEVARRRARGAREDDVRGVGDDLRAPRAGHRRLAAE